MRLTRITAILFFSCIALAANGQEIGMTGTKANAERVMADSLLKNQQYAQALPIYSRLLEQHSRDPQIQLNLGICYLYGTRRMDLAVKFLSQASTGDVSSIVYFYLAEALRQSYRFSEAIDYYRRFTISGGASDIKLEEVEQLVTLCENGSFLTRYIYNPEVYDTKAVAAGEACTFYSIAPKSGSFVNAPTNLLTPTDIKENHQPLMFYPTNPTPGTYVYYSSYGSTTTYGKDIFRIQLQDNGSWSKPENLGDVVNSNFDEDYPYIIPDGVTLYFASKGHYGMGGYDIFRTVFDPTTKRWSPPENLAFPINSPFDDFLFVADDSDSLACFATNRKVMPDTVEVILMRNEQNPIRRSPRSYSELDSIAALKVSTLALNAPTKNPTTVQAEKPIAASQKPASFNSVENDPEYSRTIAKGFAAQQLADSLKIKLEGLRGKFDFVTTAEQRIRLEKQVVQVEDDMLAAQKEADLMFVRASQIEQEYLTGKRKPKGDESLSFVSDNPDYIYQAQFAPTVFQTDELNRLAQAEQLYPQVLRNRNLALTNRDIYDQCKKNSTDSSTKVCDTKYADMLSSMQSYNEQMGKYYEKKYPIYNDCVHVALVKSGSNDQSIRKCISTAYSHFRAAGTILNNMGNDGRVESAFEANLLRELGLLQLDLAFAKIWHLQLFEQKLTSSIIKFERSAFGSTSAIELLSAEQSKPQQAAASSYTPPRIERVSSPVNIENLAVESEISSDFGISKTSPYNEENPIPAVSALPNGICYKIQLGVYGTPRQPQFFKGIYPISAEPVGKLTRYYAGVFARLADAESALSKVKSVGFRDAFIVAWYNGQQVSLQRAQQLEGSLQQQKSSDSDRKGVFAIQLGVYEGSMPNDELKTIRTLIPNKDITRRVDERGLMVYSIGNFSTLSEAERNKDNLIAGGILNAKVIELNQ
ncbi:MAG TPA: hypothetical protein PLA42_01615 [Tenuifilaceae bacterium]|nr:hypothetical protein [Tenuifilaceae bacterium]HQQ28981.1 hypothetical protein [Tenuifilaceae bacterium]